MKKEEFLKRLEENISILEKEERKKIISNYRTKINKRIKQKEKETDVIDSFGDVELLSKNILREKGIKPESSDKKKIETFFGGFISLIENIASLISKKSTKDIFKMILELLIIIFIIAIMKIPFILIQQIIEGIFEIFGTLGGAINKVIDYCFELAYIIVALFMFVALFKKRFEKYRDEENAS